MTYKTYEVTEHDDGTQSWRLNGNLHREDGPAIITSTGNQEWWVTGKLHREDGPAVVWVDGHQEWWVTGNHHREDGPAVIWSDGTQEWWVNGKQLTEEQFNNRNKSCAGTIVEIDGKKYKLTEV